MVLIREKGKCLLGIQTKKMDIISVTDAFSRTRFMVYEWWFSKLGS